MAKKFGRNANIRLALQIDVKDVTEKISLALNLK